MVRPVLQTVPVNQMQGWIDAVWVLVMLLNPWSIAVKALAIPNVSPYWLWNATVETETLVAYEWMASMLATVSSRIPR